MKFTVLAVVLALLMFTAALAADRPTEATGSFSFSDVKGGDQVSNLGFNLDAPIGSVLQLGPALGITHVKPDMGDSLYVTSFGGRLTLNLMGKNGLFVAAGALYNFGDASGYVLVPEVGVKFGGDGGFVRVSASHPYHYDRGSDSVDLQRTEVTAAIGLRF